MGVGGTTRGRQRRRLLIVGAVMAGLLGLAYFSVRERPELYPIQRAVREGLAPLQYAVTQTVYRFRAGIRTAASIRRAQDENRALKQVIARLQTENAALREARRENERWNRIFQFVQETPVKMAPAQVIGRDPSNWFSYVLINKGKRQGLKVNQPVLTEAGVVGTVRQVTDNTALVLLLLDSRSAIGGQVAETRDYVLVEGFSDEPGKAIVKPLASEVRLRKGQTIITSGLGQVFPKGLTIGRIERIVKGKYGLAPSGVVKPAVSFSRLEEVAVMVGGLPPTATEVRLPALEEAVPGER